MEATRQAVIDLWCQASPTQLPNEEAVVLKTEVDPDDPNVVHSTVQMPQHLHTFNVLFPYLMATSGTTYSL